MSCSPLSVLRAARCDSTRFNGMRPAQRLRSWPCQPGAWNSSVIPVVHLFWTPSFLRQLVATPTIFAALSQ
jgi:hypothetical protein